MSQAITHVANASGRNLQVYYNSDQMSLEEIEVVFGVRACDSKIQHICIPVSDYGKIVTEGAIYVTVFMGDHHGCGECLNIAHNFYIPNDRSFIITANRNLKFQKYGANIWEDEDGYNHKC